jgi:hypothetical protein
MVVVHMAQLMQLHDCDAAAADVSCAAAYKSCCSRSLVSYVLDVIFTMSLPGMQRRCLQQTHLDTIFGLALPAAALEGDCTAEFQLSQC